MPTINCYLAVVNGSTKEEKGSTILDASTVAAAVGEKAHLGTKLCLSAKKPHILGQSSVYQQKNQACSPSRSRVMLV